MKKYIFLVFVFASLLVHAQEYELTNEVKEAFSKVNAKLKSSNLVKIDWIKNGDNNGNLERAYLNSGKKTIKKSEQDEIIDKFNEYNDKELYLDGNLYKDCKGCTNPIKFRDIQEVRDFLTQIENLKLVGDSIEKDTIDITRPVSGGAGKIEKTDLPDFIIIAISILLGACIMYLITYFLNRNILDSKDRQMRSLSDEIANLRKDSDINGSKTNNTADIRGPKFKELEETNERHLTKIAELESEIKLLKDEKPKIEDEIKGGGNETSKTTFYLSTPNANGSFRDTRSNTMNPSTHMYEFIIIDDNTANFKLIDNPVIVQEAINAPESYLKPVCDYVGGFNSSAKSIRTTEMGIVDLKGDRWELRTKAKIRLI